MRYYARPRATRARTRIERYALTFFRIALGLSSPNGTTRWAHTSRAAFLGGATGDQTLVLCDAAGDIRWLDLETGSVLRRRSLNEAVIACAVQSERPRPGDSPPNPAPLEVQLTEAIATEGEALVPMQLELLDDMGRLTTDAATRGLVRLATSSRGDSADRARVRARAAALLSGRRRGLDAAVDTLASGALDIPVGPLVDALVAGRPARAATVLAWRLQDPRWSPSAVTRIAEGLEQLATPQQTRLLVVFFGRIRCLEPALADAVVSVARTLVRLGEGDVVRKVASVACDDSAIKERLDATANDAGGGP